MQQEQGNRFKRRTVDIDSLKQRQQSKAMRRRAFYIGLFLILSIVFTAVCFIVFFKIKAVEVEGSSRYSNEEIIAAFGVESDSNLYSFTASELEKEMVQQLPYLSNVEIERDLPSTVIIHVTEKKPDMYVEISGDRYLLTNTMQILEYTDDPAKLYGLLRVDMEPETVARCIVGEKLLFADVRTGDVVEQAFSDIVDAGLGGRVDYIDANNRFGIYLGVDGKYDIFMGDIEEFDTKLAFAVGILDKLSTIPGDTDKGTIDVSEINKGIYRPK